MVVVWLVSQPDTFNPRQSGQWVNLFMKSNWKGCKGEIICICPQNKGLISSAGHSIVLIEKLVIVSNASKRTCTTYTDLYGNMMTFHISANATRTISVTDTCYLTYKIITNLFRTIKIYNFKIFKSETMRKWVNGVESHAHLLKSFFFCFFKLFT